MGYNIRLRRRGSIRRPVYSIVVLRDTRGLKGYVYDVIGTYNIIYQGGQAELFIHVDKKRLLYWLAFGAKIENRLRKEFFLILEGERDGKS